MSKFRRPKVNNCVPYVAPAAAYSTAPPHPSASQSSQDRRHHYSQRLIKHSSASVFVEHIIAEPSAAPAKQIETAAATASAEIPLHPPPPPTAASPSPSPRAVPRIVLQDFDRKFAALTLNFPPTISFASASPTSSRVMRGMDRPEPRFETHLVSTVPRIPYNLSRAHHGSPFLPQGQIDAGLIRDAEQRSERKRAANVAESQLDVASASHVTPSAASTSHTRTARNTSASTSHSPPVRSQWCEICLMSFTIPSEEVNTRRARLHTYVITYSTMISRQDH